MKTIHVLTKYFYPVAAGIETNILETYSHLAQKKWRVVIHTSIDTHTGKDVLAQHQHMRGLEVSRYRWHIWGFWPNIPWKSSEIIALHNFNVFPHVLILSYAIIRKFFRLETPVIVLTPHGGCTPEWRMFREPVRTLKHLYHSYCMPYLINTAIAKVRTISRWETTQLRAIGVRDKILHEIPNGIENEAFNTQTGKVSKDVKNFVKSWGTYIIQIGRVYKIKNYETAIRALSLLPSWVHYVIVGEPEGNGYLPYLQSIIRELHLENRVHFAGVLRKDEKYFVLSHAKAMVHMALYESFCNVVHEAMSQGVISVVSNTTALPYLVENGVTGFCVDTFDFKEVAKKLQWILESKSSRIKSMKELMRKNVKTHTWKEVAHAWSAILQTI